MPLLPFDRTHLTPGTRVCVAISGGADSVALLTALHTANTLPRESLGVGLSAVHVHHGLRAEEADADAAFVQDLCTRLNIPLQTHHTSVPAHVEQTGETIEEAARTLRYEIFHKLLAEGHADVLLTAHTLDDQAETVLMKLLRGAWTEGLSAIHPVLTLPKGKILRPLLDTSRAQIVALLTETAQPWREDSSNASPAHTRNRLRHDILPILRAENPSLDRTLANLAELAREEETRWQTELSRLLPQILLPGKPVRGGGRSVGTAPGSAAVAIELDRLRALDAPTRRRVLRAAARSLGPNGPRLSFDETARLLSLCGFRHDPTVAARPGTILALSQNLRAERSPRELRLYLQPSAIPQK
ncbi:tRNA lysidine(34) synthetase TilS [Granulicella sibirica]|uniref:tRNA(Ile)-lysidine synthase n=1 Tax=Granulicella sibirica TaxID=2479048 RepID=A0A4Q0T096_9BACT|nr:tRNA lysidine(34) synthetase TilS [Granulicella sibirica]RXH55358.1 tRNA(Ile)-lysidine synthetase [Granulicella sibirica]